MADPGELDPRARALLGAYRDRSGPPPDVQARLRAAVLRDARDKSSGTLPEAPVRELRSRWAAPAVLVALAAAALAALSLRTAERTVADASGAAAPWELAPGAPTPAERRAPARPQAAPDPAPPRPAAPEPAPTLAPARAPTLAPAPAPTVATPADPTLRTGAKHPVPKAIQPPPTDDLAAEMQAMRPAQRALAEDRPADALAELERYAARFPAGLLHEEYRALHAIALCAAGRAREGRGEARVFLRDLGASMFAARVRLACDLADGPTEPASGGHPPGDGPPRPF